MFATSHRLATNTNDLGENMITSSDPQIQYLLNYVNQCWENRQYYKDEQSKLLYWIGGTFTAVVVATGILGAIQKPDFVLAFQPIHAIVFHVLFLIAWYFLLYKQLNADMYEFLGLEAEKALMEKIGGISAVPLPILYEVKGHYLGKFSEVTRGRLLVVFANLLLLFLYLGVVTSPLWNVSTTENALVVSWETLGPIVFFTILAVAGVIIYQTAKKRMVAHAKTIGISATYSKLT
jgi:hypothetical protein